MYADHQDSFEKERKFHQILGNACRENPIIKARTVKKIIAHVAPDFLDGLFEPRPCLRRLKYIGCGCEDIECSHGPEFFKMGEIYESFDFNGATYSIKEYKDGKRRIGFAYFEWIE